jgi:rod shape determining protein RodA
MTFLYPESDPLGDGYNIIQSKIAIGSGGLTGKGYLHGSQSQLEFLPEHQTDFIFTMFSEEFGFLGGGLMLGAFALIIITGTLISLRCQNHFGRLVATGITTMFFLHVFINVGMNMGMLPVVGTPLPLLSYGGTILITMLIGFGFLLNSYVHRDVYIDRGGWKAL